MENDGVRVNKSGKTRRRNANRRKNTHESQEKPKLLLSPGRANIQHIDETSKPLQLGMNQKSLFWKVGKSIYKS